jgi:putative resolvase
MWRAGQLPVPAEQLPTGTIIVKEIKTPAHAVALYARVSSSEQRKDLEAQLGRLVVYSWPTRRSRPSWSSIATG